MRKKNVFRKFLIVLAFVIFPLAGYMTVSNVTSCQAQTCPCGGGNCVESSGDAYGSLGDAFIAVYTSIIAPALISGADSVLNQLTAYLNLVATVFWDGMMPVMQWTVLELDSWFDTYWYYNLLPTMQAMTNELSTAVVEQTNALGTFSDAANIIRARRVLDDMSLEDHREQRPSENVCTAATMAGGMERATGFTDSYGASAANGKLWVSANQQGMPSAGGTASYMEFVWQNSGGSSGYVPFWCNASYNNGNAGCTANGKFVDVGSGALALPDDVDVAGQIFGQDTIDLSASNEAACIADPTANACTSDNKTNIDGLIGNLAEPFSKDPVTAQLPAGKLAFLQSVAYKAKRQVIYDGLFYVISRRVPAGMRPQSQGIASLPNQPAAGQGFLDLLTAIRGETGENITTSLNPSRNEILRTLMTQRFRTGQYALGQIDEPENNQREMVIEQALQLMQMSDQLDLLDHYSLLLASQVSTEVEGQTNFSAAAEGVPLR